MKNISLLIGSGFSAPAGFPTAPEMNERLRKIDATEIGNYTDESAWFLEGEKNPNPSWKNRFVQEFLEFYNDCVLKPDEKFHYEIFFDYYNQWRSLDEYPEDLTTFLKDFLEKYHVDTDEHDLLFQFDLIFNQLIRHLLSKPFDRAYSKAYPKEYDSNYLKYKAFLDLVNNLHAQYAIHIHSLNHDLYLEHLATFDNISTELDNGFEEFGSPYYGWLRDEDEDFMVRLSRFTNKFEQQICLYKLHGGIDHYWFRDDDGNIELIKLKKKINKIDVFKEVIIVGKSKYVNHPMHIYSDFLSGTTAKIERYDRGTYYPAIFKHFEDNLISSNNLITIGYGFADSKINHCLKTFFLTNAKKVLFEVGRNDSKSSALQNDAVHFMSGGVEAIDLDFILNNLA